MAKAGVGDIVPIYVQVAEFGEARQPRQPGIGDAGAR
jgi:hypothetical protein